MEQVLRLYDHTGTEVDTTAIRFEDDSVIQNAVMGDSQIILHFYLETYKEFKAGSFVYYPYLTDEEISSKIVDKTISKYYYRLKRAAQVTIHNRTLFEYELTLLSPQGMLSSFAMIDTINIRDPYYHSSQPKYVDVANNPAAEFSLTTTPAVFIEKVVKALNVGDRAFSTGGKWYNGQFIECFLNWEVGECITGSEKAISFSNNNCMEALNLIADAYETEWYVEGMKIGLKKRQINSDSPLSLAYGKGQGLVSGIRRNNSNKTLINHLYVKGTERNIVKKDYEYKTLHLPIIENDIDFDGEYTSLDSGYIASAKVATFYVDAYRGQFIYMLSDTRDEADGFFDGSEVYPSKELTATSVLFQYLDYYGDYAGLIAAYPVLGDTDNDAWQNVQVDIVASANTDNYNNYKVKGETMSIVFQTGELAGKEFSVKTYYHSAIGTKPAKRFAIVRASIDGYMMPIYPFIPATGDKFVVFNVGMPSSYYEEAEKAMLRKACKYLWENNREKYSIEATLDGIWATQNWASVESKLVLCGCVKFTDSSVQPEPLDLRITSISFPINRNHAPEVEFSNDYKSYPRRTRRLKDSNKSVEVDMKLGNQKNGLKRAVSDASASSPTGCIRTGTGSVYYMTNEVGTFADTNTGSAEIEIVFPSNPVAGQHFDVIKSNTSHAIKFSAGDESIYLTATTKNKAYFSGLTATGSKKTATMVAAKTAVVTWKFFSEGSTSFWIPVINEY